MKLSDAMRLADEIGLPDLRRKFVQRHTLLWAGEKPPCCAIGGANIAAGHVWIVPFDGMVPHEQMVAASSTEGFDGIPTGSVKCPGGGCDEVGVEAVVIICLYDRHDWSRTRIADWLDTLDVPA